MQPPERVAGDLMGGAEELAGVALDRDARTRRGEHGEAVGGAERAQAEQV